MKYKTILSSCILILAISLVIAGIGSTRYEWYTGINNSQDWVSGSGRFASQSFTVGTVGSNVNFTLKGVNISIYKTGTPGKAYLSLYADNGSGVKTGNILSYGEMLEGDMETAGVWENISMSDYTLVAGTTYVLELNASDGDGSSGDAIRWHYNESGDYAGGTRCLYESGDWSCAGTIDHLFEIWGDPIGGSSSNYSQRLYIGTEHIRFGTGGRLMFRN